ncbi:hypothetical protein PROFUN_06157 [Planoprotostelium fungivorum]|uniref:Protein kinase domain-containing protein n=1 Tax=Planoprotostelium fungivorum TaxID=1890364 RepID=A0A2P6NPK4_9EUKA|nr:hypothetical protein PROFUN_06157 [Planoprotostelium fungivorum]
MKDEDRSRLKTYFDQGDPDELFILEEEIASGSFGVVYKGRHADNGDHFAVKIITPEEDEVLDDFLVEITILRKCKHRNIVGFFGAWMKGEELFIAMELCDGGAVSDIYQVCNEPLNEDQIGVITRETLHALSYLHSINIIHRDIKGANILLTNSGDIKLVDFGVSAELKQASEKRNTLIGTPYWMAPEVVANKTGNVPYDVRSDIWSLGITLIELGEMNPPLHEIHPMKALMMIPMREPPTFQHPDKWSREFKDFVATCLVKSPEKRKTAEEMLKHPWILQTKDNSVLVDLIQKRKKAESAAGEPEGEEDTEDSSDEDGESNKDKSNTYPERHSDSAIPVNAIQSNPEVVNTPERKEQKSIRPATQNNRPTYRTNKKMTKRDIKAYEKDLVSKQQMKEQLKELRKLQGTHLSQTEAQQRRHQKEKDVMVTKTETSKQNRLRQQQRDLERLVLKHKTEREEFDRKSQVNQKNLIKNQQVALKQSSKFTENDQKNEHKVFQDQIKQQTKEIKDDWKAKEKGKTLAKKDLKNLKLMRENEVEWLELLFAHKQSQAVKVEEHGKKTELYREQARSESEMLDKKHYMEWDHLSQLQKFQAEAVHAAQTAAVDFYAQMFPLETKLLMEKHDLSRTQLQEQQQTEREQQNKLLITEFRGQTRDHKKKQQSEVLAMQNEMKQFVKDNKGISKAQIKQKSGEAKDALAQKQAKDTKEFEERQHKQRTEEEDMVRRHQAAKVEQQKEDFEEETKKMNAEHQECIRKMNEDHTLHTKNLLIRHQTEEGELLADLQTQMKTLKEEQHREYDALLLEYHSSLLALVDLQHQEQLRLRQKHRMETDQVQRDQEDEKTRVRQRQDEERESWSRTKAVELEEMQGVLEEQTRNLKAVHGEGKLRRTNATEASYTSPSFAF